MAILEVVMKAGATAGAGQGKGGSDDGKDRGMIGNIQGGLKKAGIQFGLASLLKQSQVFTSYMGSIFQILGALIDVTLAPFLPLFIPVLKFLAKMMPGAAAVGKVVANAIISGLEWIKKHMADPLGKWWNENTPDWMHMSGDKLAMTAGGIFAAIFLLKVTRLWKFGAWFLGLKVGMKGAEKTIGKILLTKFGQLLAAPFKWIGALVKKFATWISGTGLYKIAVSFLSKVWEKVANFGKWISSPFIKFFKLISTGIKSLVAAPMKMLKGIANVIMKTLAKPFELLGKGLAKIPGLSGAAKALGGLFKGGATSLLGKIGLKSAGKGLMTLPGVGVLAGAALGGYETYQQTKKYGWKGAAAGLAYTGTMMAGGAMGGPAGLAVAIGAEVALHQIENRVLKVQVEGPDRQTKVSMESTAGKEQMIRQTELASDYLY